MCFPKSIWLLRILRYPSSHVVAVQNKLFDDKQKVDNTEVNHSRIYIWNCFVVKNDVLISVLSVSAIISVLSALSAMENPIKLVEYSDSNSKTSMLSLRRTGLHIIYSIPLLFLKIPQTNEILCVLSVSVNYSLFVLSALSAKENPIKLVEYSGSSSKIDTTTNMKALSSPFYLLFNTNLFLCFLRCFYKSLQICVI